MHGPGNIVMGSVSVLTRILQDFNIIQRVHCDCKRYCTLHKKHRENAGAYVSINLGVVVLHV